MTTQRRPSAVRYTAISPVLAALLLALAACSQPQTPPNVQSIVTGVTAEDVFGTVHSGEPESDPEAPDASVTGAETIVPGGSAIFTVSGSAPFTTIYVSIVGTPDYFEIPVEETTSQDVVLSFSATARQPAYTLRFAVGNDNGAGTAALHSVAVEGVGTGELQVSVSWDVPSDLDLQVIDPSGERIYWNNRVSASGGELDLDANANCTGPDLRTENVTWEGSTPPTGTYQVIVNYYSACSQDQTKYVVTVRIGDSPPQTFEGTFTGPGTGYSETDRLITTFTYPPSN